MIVTRSPLKKTLHAAEQDRPDVAAARAELKAEQPSLEAPRLVFIDETAVTTKMVRHYGRCRRGERLVAKVPHGHWKTMTLVTALRIDSLTAPYVIDGATSPAATPLASPMFLIRAEQLVPDKLEIYKLESKNGHREVLFQRKKKQTARPIHRNVTRLGENLYRIDVEEALENGEYSITPSESNQVFCFRVY